MIHPHTEVRFVNPAIGYGVFATRDIPRGAIVYVRDRLEQQFAQRSGNRPGSGEAIGRRAVFDGTGVHILGRDNARYLNHRCDANTLATAYGFDIAVRDIPAGQELSGDYGLFLPDATVPLACGCTRCRRSLRPDDLETHHARWDDRIIPALAKAADVHQPLMRFMDDGEKQRLRAYLCGAEPYASVLELRLARRIPPVSMVPPDATLSPSLGING